jgi:hypothetical protein
LLDLEVFVACNYTFAFLAAYLSIPCGRTCVPAFAAVCDVVMQIGAFFAARRVSALSIVTKHSNNKESKQNGACKRHFERNNDAILYFPMSSCNACSICFLGTELETLQDQSTILPSRHRYNVYNNFRMRSY